ncbi:hypothetical protein [Streptosporangium sp. NPDC000396]|uniref:hypothetical protein n=1 Tax=Streptosporangium sp. NPDC000396 TaxID=3366185 RepID=UPI0036B2E8BB
MGKFDGMDPELVRDLLSEVRQAAVQMRTAEGRITQMMSGAGLSSQSTHRPAQIADACDVMVRDVSARVTLLEKKIKQETGAPAPPKAGESRPESPGTGDPKPENGSDATPDTKRPAPKAEDLKPAVPKTDENPRTDHPADNAPKGDHKGTPHPDPKPDPRGETGSKGDETSPREGGSTSGDGRGEPGAKREVVTGESVSANDADPKGETGSKGDERSPRGDGTSSGDQILDTPKKDHPDDIDQTGNPGPRVVVVDGVKMLQIPLNSPTAAEVGELLKNAGDTPSPDMSAVSGTADAVGARFDGPGQAEPYEPVKRIEPAFPVLDTVEPALDPVTRPPDAGANPDTGGNAGTQPPGTASDGAGARSAETVPEGATARSAEGPIVQLADDSGDVKPEDPSWPVPPPGGWPDGQSA